MLDFLSVLAGACSSFCLGVRVHACLPDRECRCTPILLFASAGACAVFLSLCAGACTYSSLYVRVRACLRGLRAHGSPCPVSVSGEIENVGGGGGEGGALITIVDLINISPLV
jgi:hypothetical protein